MLAFLTQPTGALDLSQGYAHAAMTWLSTQGVLIGILILKFVGILIVTSMLASALAKATARVLDSSKLHVGPGLKSFTHSTVRRVTFIVGVVIALGSVGVNVTPVVAGLGVTGMVLGFALKDTLANFASGLMVLLYHPFDVGDIVKLGAHEGEVVDITLNATILTTPEAKRIIIPNGKVWGDAIVNYTVLGLRRAEVLLTLPANQDLAKAREVLVAAAKGVPNVMTSPAPEVLVFALQAAGALQVAVRAFAKPADLVQVQADLINTSRDAVVTAGLTLG
jgi:small conductance mechanosensitive channel